jgi:hypothetical protein
MGESDKVGAQREGALISLWKRVYAALENFRRTAVRSGKAPSSIGIPAGDGAKPVASATATAAVTVVGDVVRQSVPFGDIQLRTSH